MVRAPASMSYQMLAVGVMHWDCQAAMLDGGTSANPFRLVQAAKIHGLPASEVVERVHVSRGFTPHQLLSLCTDGLNELAGKLAGKLKLVWVNGISLFSSNDLSPGEGKVLRNRALDAVSRVAREQRLFVAVSERADSGGGHAGPRKQDCYRFHFGTGVITMGRSVPSYRNQLEHMISRWNSYRKALPAGERTYLDSVIQKARRHAAEGAALGAVDPLEPLLLAVLLEQEKRISRLETREKLG